MNAASTIILLLTVMLWACSAPSLHPLYTPESLVQDSGLVGEWVTDGATVTRVVVSEARDGQDCKSLVDAAVSEFGGLDAAVNNAGVEQSGRPILEATDAEFDRIMHINVRGVLMGMKHQIPAIRARGGGAIVNIASIAGLIGFPGAAVYVASKHAVLGLTKTAALEHANDGIRINAVCPGAIQTEMIERFVHRDPTARAALEAAHPLRRFGQPSEVTSAILWLCSTEASFVTGQQVTVDGGYTAQ